MVLTVRPAQRCIGVEASPYMKQRITASKGLGWLKSSINATLLVCPCFWESLEGVVTEVTDFVKRRTLNQSHLAYNETPIENTDSHARATLVDLCYLTVPGS